MLFNPEHQEYSMLWRHWQWCPTTILLSNSTLDEHTQRHFLDNPQDQRRGSVSKQLGEMALGSANERVGTRSRHESYDAGYKEKRLMKDRYPI